MRIYNIADVKEFMKLLLKSAEFDVYEARGVILRTFTQFEIDCVSNVSEAGKAEYCKWEQIKPVVLSLLKSGAPTYMKVLLTLSGEKALEVAANAASLHLTATFDNGALNVLTGSSQLKFSIANNVDAEWDKFIYDKLSLNGIEAVEPD